jgi:hypothetical protein
MKNRVSPSTVAGKLTNLVKQHARCVAKITEASINKATQHRSGYRRLVSLPAVVSCCNNLKPTRHPHPPTYRLILAPLLSLIVLSGLAFAATPAMAEFGLERMAISARNSDGTPDVQAGSHPYALNTTFVLHDAGPAAGEGDLKDVHVELPPGFVGDPTATPRCTYQEFIKEVCSNETAVGLATTYLANVSNPGTFLANTIAIYNIVPPPGVAAEFGYIVLHETPVLLETSVRTGGDYGLTTSVTDLNQAVVVGASKVTIWGVPANPAHNPWRGKCEETFGGGPTPAEDAGYGLREGEDELEGPLYLTQGQSNNHEGLPESIGVCKTAVPEAPLLTNPTSCGTSRTATLSVDDWEEPGNFATEPGNLPGEKVHMRPATLPALAGCEALNFSPTLEVKPDGEAGSTPTGLNVGLEVPQEATINPAGFAEADVKDTTVTLPAGMQLSPSAADGLQACSNAQIGFEGYRELDNSGTQSTIFKPKLYNSTSEQEEDTLCPDASKVATVKIKTPLLEGELEGSVYLAAPQNFVGLPENPFSSLVALYLVAEEKERGVEVKLAGKVTPNPVTGQITTTFENTPQLPFSDLKLEFYGTDRAPLATPSYCGTYGTGASLEPWSATPPGGTSSGSVSPVADFNISSGPNGSSCTYPGQSLPFSPSLTSDTTVTNAGAFTPLDTTLTREDGQQAIQQVTLHYPAGLTGLISGVKLCGEAEANAGTCSSASEIGETIVSVGEGNDPFSVTGGKVYITGPYEGAPFGLSIVNPAKAGPFVLEEGRPVVVRAKIEINPSTAALTVTTNTAAEGHAIPTILDGIPLQIKHVDVNITRPGFTINPTNCSKTQVTGTVVSAEGASSPVSIPFQVGECRSLAFAPKFSVSTPSRTSKADGAGLTAKLSYPAAAQGTQANIAKVKVDLPKQLPSRLTTLQKACTDKQFETNPANCPSASKIGYAVVHTPLLPVPLEGPAIFVSHGGEAFPSLTLVLQGDNVTIDLVGTTFISHAGITSTTFKTVPDQPFSTFQLTLAQGKYSALAANLPAKDKGSFCGQTLSMPTAFVAQNGTEIHETTPISISGCAKVKALTRSQKLQKALKACKKKAKGKRASCEKVARKDFGPKQKGSPKKK